MTNKRTVTAFLCLLLLLALSVPAVAEESDAELAKKTQNPVASLISVPLQNNWDFGIGPADATKYTLNIQPVIPILDHQGVEPHPPDDSAGHLHGVAGSGRRYEIRPRRHHAELLLLAGAEQVDGWVVGAGPVFLYPTGADAFSSKKWGAGPTAVALKQENGWTVGMLANHIWSFAGTSGNRT